MHQCVTDFVLCLANIFIHVLKQLQKGVKNKNRSSVWWNWLNLSASVYGRLDLEPPAFAGSLMCFPHSNRKAEMEDRRDISCLPCKHIKICCSRKVNKSQVCLLLQEAPIALATSPHEQRRGANVFSKVLNWMCVGVNRQTGRGKDFTFSFEESVGWTNFLYSTLEPFV